MKTVKTEDSFQISTRQMTPEGFLRASATLARTGIQQYYATELFSGDEMPQGVKPYDVISLHRPAEQVFAGDSLQSFAHQTLTDDHPDDGVNAKNWKQLAVGHTLDVKRLGDLMVADILVKDATMIQKIKDGKVELSNGYTFQPDMTPGTTEAGVAYDGIMTNIVGNHIAFVAKGRCGPACRIADNATIEGVDTMPRKITVDGAPYEVDDASAVLVERLVSQRDTAVAGLTEINTKISNIKIGDTVFKKVPELIGAHRKLLADHAELQKKVMTPEALQALITDHATTIATAKSLDKEMVTDGKTADQIRREALAKLVVDNDPVKAVVDAVLGSVDLEKADEATVAKAFRAGAAAAQSTAGRKTTGDDALSRALLTGDTTKSEDSEGEVYGLRGREAMIHGMTHSWMDKPAQSN